MSKDREKNVKRLRPSPPRGLGRAGRPLDPTRDVAIIRAALDGLAEVGYDRLSMEEIATRAHAGKGALYRRWPSKAALVVDAVVAWREQLAPLSVPNTGSLRGDFEELVATLPTFDAEATERMGVVVGLVTAAGRDPELRAELSHTVLQPPRQALRDPLDRAVARGEIPPGCDVELVADMLIGLNLLRVLLGQPLDAEFVHRVLDTVIFPLVVSAPGPPARRGARDRSR
jgi:AcrR family transcriptional regulator